MDSSPPAPATAIHCPTPDQLNSAMNWPRTKASTMNEAMSLTASAIATGTSAARRNEPVA